MAGKPKHPWDNWFERLAAGNRLRLVRSKHYDCVPYAMSIQFRREAAKRKRHVTICILEDTLLVEEA